MSNGFLSLPPEIHMELAAYLPANTQYNLSVLHPSLKVYAVLFTRSLVKQIKERLRNQASLGVRVKALLRNTPLASNWCHRLKHKEETYIAEAVFTDCSLVIVMEELISLYQREKSEREQEESDSVIPAPLGPAGQALLFLLRCLVYTATRGKNLNVSMIKRIGAVLGKDLNTGSWRWSPISVAMSHVIVLLETKRRGDLVQGESGSCFLVGSFKYEAREEIKVAQNRLFECFSSLLDSGLDLKLNTRQRSTFDDPLEDVYYSSVTRPIFYMEDGELKHIRKKEFKSALICACYYRNLSLVRFLVEKGAEFEQDSRMESDATENLIVASIILHDDLFQHEDGEDKGSLRNRFREFTTKTLDLLTYLAPRVPKPKSLPVPLQIFSPFPDSPTFHRIRCRIYFEQFDLRDQYKNGVLTFIQTVDPSYPALDFLSF